MRVISLNLNGLRASLRKGLGDFIAHNQPDYLCFQELKAHASDIAPHSLLEMEHWQQHWHSAQRKGYSGVSIWQHSGSSQSPTLAVHPGLGVRSYDDEGRVLRVDSNGFSLLSVYVPSGSSQAERQDFKMAFLQALYSYIQQLLSEGRSLLICGDFNIAHQAIDLKNWRANQQRSGFLAEERAWLSSFLALGLVDVYRQLLGESGVAYSWWSLRSRARERNVGWRLDYHFATPDIAATAQQGSIPITPILSDHAPVIIDYAWC